MPKKKEKTETSKEIIEDIEKSGVEKKIAKKEEKLDEKAMKESAIETAKKDLEKKKKAILEKAK